MKSSSYECLTGALDFHGFSRSSFKKLIFVLIFNGKYEAVTQPFITQVRNIVFSGIYSFYFGYCGWIGDPEPDWLSYLVFLKYIIVF